MKNKQLFATGILVGVFCMLCIGAQTLIRIADQTDNNGTSLTNLNFGTTINGKGVGIITNFSQIYLPIGTMLGTNVVIISGGLSNIVTGSNFILK